MSGSALCLIPTVGVCTGSVCVWAGQSTSNWTGVAAWGCLSPSASSKRDWDPGAATGHMHIYIYIFSSNGLSSQSAREGNRIRSLELCLRKCCVFCLCGQPCTYVDTSMYICIYVHMYSVRVCVCLLGVRAQTHCCLGPWSCGSLAWNELLDLAASLRWNPNHELWIWGFRRSMNPFTEENNKDTSISFPVTTPEKGYGTRTGWGF